MEKSVNRFLSIQSYMELFQCAKTKTQHKYVKDFGILHIKPKVVYIFRGNIPQKI